MFTTGSTLPHDALTIELYYDGGASTAAHTFTEWRTYATCHTCVLLTQGGDDGSTERSFEVRSGELEVFENEAGADPGAFRAELRDALAVEVTIDPSTYESTEVPGGQSWCITSFEVDVTTIDPYRAR